MATVSEPFAPSPSARDADTEASPADRSTHTRRFPVVGIGCSAGGLEALDKFLRAAPVHGGMAFVIVQHLAPEHASVLPEILQRSTTMPVHEISDGMVVLPNHVYVIPPNKDLSLLHGTLRLLEPVHARGPRLPVDFFLRSLAADLEDKAIGVILSGMGSDGVLGLRAIKEKAGLTLAQDPASAQSDSMPRSALEAGVVDIAGLPQDLPGRIARYIRHPVHELPLASSARPEVQSALDKIIIMLRDRSGNDFSLYKTSTLYRRIERRMAVHLTATIHEYVVYLRANAQELDLLFKELLIGVTSFFRDPAVWDYLVKDAIPALLARHPTGLAARAWVPACSTGEEAYSLAMVFREAVELAKPTARFTLQIYATDLDTDAIQQARTGLYHANIAADVSAERLARYFVAQEGGGYRVSKEVREMVVFATQNIISDPPFTKLDILTCRNLLIYFGSVLQKKLLPLFYYALNRDGLLLLGSAETASKSDQLFEPLSSKVRLFRRLDRKLSPAALEFPGGAGQGLASTAEASPVARAENLEQLTDRLIQQNYAPAAVLVNAEGDILYISGRTGKYLEPAAGKINMNVHAMAREGLREALTGLIRKALKDLLPIRLNGLKVGTDGGTQVVDLTVQAIDRPEPLRGRVLLVFKDVPAPVRRRTAKSVVVDTQTALQLELQQTREALQVTHEEMQATVEEVKSSNEELQSTNEEMQSTNEELTTSKEELQSLNEELQTVNAELQSKVDDLTWVRNDMTNLLNSTEIATVFLDSEMKLRRFTTHATNVFKLIPGDVDRPLTHVVMELDYPRLQEDAVEVLRTLAFKEKVAATRDGRWYRVRIMPYRTHENVINGVVITFTDVTELKLLESRLAERVA